VPDHVIRPDTDRALATLRDFQRATVEYVFARLYGDDDPVRRFLVADEVGLGKTLVARGLVAKVVDRLWDEVQRIDIVYICSNASIARQNVSRLNITDSDDLALPSRITLLPATIKDLKRNRLNFVSFTPGTSFSLRSRLGTAQERALLYWLLPDAWKESRYAAITLLAGAADRAGFDRRVEQVNRDRLNAQLRDDFHTELARKPAGAELPLHKRFHQLVDRVGHRVRLTDEERTERNQIVGDLRSALAASCVEALEPDLIILDEFQRFKHLLDGEDPASLLARRLFDYARARVLLLSATPYKMYTLHDEAGGEDHFKDFVQTMAFLQNDPSRTGLFKDALGEYRRELMRYTAGDGAGLIGARNQIQSELRRVVARTERLAVTPDRNGMLAEVVAADSRLSDLDVDHYLALQRVARVTGAADTVEYWKSAPYLLNFMEDYDLKRSFKEVAGAPEQGALCDALLSSPSAWLSRSDIERFERIDPVNLRLRTLMADLEKTGAWDVPWIPPSCPYYRGEAPFAGRASGLTKRLVFSAWQVVPKVLAALLSHEAERRLLGTDAGDEPVTNAREARERHRGLLRFSVKEGRPANMPVLGLLYPSFTLAESFDPLQTAGALRQRDSGEMPTLDAVLTDTADRLRVRLEGIAVGNDPASAEDRDWYWAAPILLDLLAEPEAQRRWWGQAQLTDLWRPPVRARAVDDTGVEEPEPSDAWQAHVKAARRLLDRAPLGRQPADLSNVMALLAVAGPGAVALRTLARVTGDLRRCSNIALRNFAGPIADGWCSYFNLPETEAVVTRHCPGEPYWLRVLEFAARGGLQAVLDEYAHVTVDAAGKRGRWLEDIAASVSSEVSGALRTRTVNVGVDAIEVDAERRAVVVQSMPRAFRSRFAIRFGTRAADDGEAGERDDVVRRAFNSPFWPFVLCSTSVGQEGLDFHQYCHAVVHWNVPSNPVDMEQREGRVHRYKNHAVRRNVATRHASVLADGQGNDPWRTLFLAAEAARDEGRSDLVPYWVYQTDGGASIERHVPVLPLSADADRARRVRRSLAVYRLAFGQCRQEDLVSYLSDTLDEDEIARVSEQLRIDLSPPSWSGGPDGVTVPPASGAGEEPAPERGVVTEWAAGARAGTDLDAVDALLDAFAALRAAKAPRFDKATFAELLDSFTAVRQQTEQR
jgi:hypothetical protein